jgi:hypothetical protein
MDKKFSIDFGIVAPILLGVFSLFGICVVFGTWLYKDERTPVQAVATETPLRYVYLGTEPGLSTLTPEPTATPEPSPTEAPPPDFEFEPTDDFILPPSFATVATAASTNVAPSATQSVVRTAVPTITPTIQSVLSKVDDTSFEILYDGDWVDQSNVIGAHQNTLHISFEAGNAALFTFAGKQVFVSYQAGPSLGSIGINLDGTDYEVSQSSAQTQLAEWRSPVLDLGAHTLLIEHLSGGSVNLDSISIPSIATATPNP